MISIVTAYYNRRALFIRTLESIMLHRGPEFEFVVVDDGSREEERIEDLQMVYPFLRVIRLEPDAKWYSNPCIPFNVAIRAARGDFLVLQNPECLHDGPILEYVHNQLRRGLYLSFGCYALSLEDTLALQGDAQAVRNQLASLKLIPQGVKEMAAEGWYNHSEYRPCGYHFCCAITREELTALGGFDERYATGGSYDDDDLLSRIRLSGLDIKFVDTPKVFHQNHYPPGIVGILGPREKRNMRLFEWVTKQATTPRANTWDWGTGDGLEVRAVNAALDAVLLNNAVVETVVDGSEQWNRFLKKRESQVLTPQTLVTLRENLRAPVALAGHLRTSLLTRWLWNKKSTEDYNRAILLMAEAEQFETSGKVDRAGKRYLESLERLAQALIAISRRRLWWPFVPRNTISEVGSQANALRKWWEELK